MVTSSIYMGNLVVLPVSVGRSIRCDAVGIAGVPESDVTLVAWTNAAGVSFPIPASASVNGALKCGPNGPTSRRLQSSSGNVEGITNASAITFAVAATPQGATGIIAALVTVATSPEGGAGAFASTTAAINSDPVLVAGLPAGGWTGPSVQDIAASGQLTPNSAGGGSIGFNGTATASEWRLLVFM